MKVKIAGLSFIIMMCFLVLRVYSADYEDSEAKRRQDIHDFIKEQEKVGKDKIHGADPLPLDLSNPERLITIWEIEKSCLCTKQTSYFMGGEMKRSVCQKGVAKDGKNTFFFYINLDDYVQLTDYLSDHPQVYPKATLYTPLISLKGIYNLEDEYPVIDRLCFSLEAIQEEQNKEKEERSKERIEVFPIVKIKRMNKPEKHQYVSAFLNFMEEMEQSLVPLRQIEFESPHEILTKNYKHLTMDLSRSFEKTKDLIDSLKRFIEVPCYLSMVNPHIIPFIKLCKRYNDPYGYVGAQYAQLTFLLMRESIELKERYNKFTNTFIPICEAAKKSQLWIGPDFAITPSFNPHKVSANLGELWQEGIEETRRQIDIYITRLRRKNILPHEILRNYEVNYEKPCEVRKAEGEKEEKEEMLAPLAHKEGEEIQGIGLVKPLPSVNTLPIDGKILALIPSRTFFGFVVYYKDKQDGLVKDVIWRQQN